MWRVPAVPMPCWCEAVTNRRFSGEAGAGRRSRRGKTKRPSAGRCPTLYSGTVQACLANAQISVALVALTGLGHRLCLPPRSCENERPKSSLSLNLPLASRRTYLVAACVNQLSLGGTAVLGFGWHDVPPCHPPLQAGCRTLGSLAPGVGRPRWSIARKRRLSRSRGGAGAAGRPASLLAR